jgi:NADH:ubiquinone oxidoreductase subunit F (NADH-binding)/(2Fe-2S) ferredoxin
VAKLKSAGELETLRKSITGKRDPNKTVIAICNGTGCQAYGCKSVTEAFQKEVARQNLAAKVDVRPIGCPGFCERGTLVMVKPQGIFYQRVRPKDVPEVIAAINKNDVVSRLLYTDRQTGAKVTFENDVPFYKKQQRLIIGNNGLIDPTSIDDYIAIGGYSALAGALKMKSEQIIEDVKKSGLRGRGGAGFPTGSKWETTRHAHGDVKYVIANADEGDPGAFMDRALVEGNPHSVLEGMIIGAFAIGAHQGYIYIRNEYPLAVRTMRTALEQAEERGLLGKNILGSGFDFSIRIQRGGGAFVCGESTALMASLEGKVGEPRAKYIHTSEQGLWGKPTNLNNVETWANVPLIINNGADWYSKIGTKGSKGTKIFSLVGNITNTGLVEVPMGTTLRQIVFDIGGGIPKGRKFKAVQTGGPSGGVIPESQLDLPVDFDELTRVGSMMGSGGMIVMDDKTCMVDMARYYTSFLEGESCGKCLPCREGLRHMHEILTRITKGKGKPEDIGLLEEISATLVDASLCQLGSSAPNPVMSTIRHFRDEYEAHIKHKKCPAGVCQFGKVKAK